MPWCEPCAKYFAPSAAREDGSCPSCGEPVQIADIHGRVTAQSLDLRALATGDEPASEKLPWHFKLLLTLLVGYLGWRVVQLFI
ncbi:MAG: hypothetical protein RL419_1948 [Actinomycetota bacterium]|jgi:hypothetical protein